MIKPKYIALLSDEKTIISKSSLELIQAIQEPIKYLIREDFDSHVVVGLNQSDLFAYTAVDLSGDFKSIELDNFVVVDLGTDGYGKYGLARSTAIKEKRSGEIRQFPTIGWPGRFILLLLPIFKTLINAGSWEAFDKFEELEKLKQEVEQLKQENRQLKSNIENLKTQAPNNTI